MFDFAQNTKIETLDGVPEQFHSFYVPVEDEGGKETFALKDTPEVKASVSTIASLHKTLKESRVQGKKKTVDLSPLSAWGESPKEMATAIQEKLNELEAKGEKKTKGDLQAVKDLDKIKADLQRGHDAKHDVMEKRTTALSGQLEKLLRGNEIRGAIVELKADPLLEDQLMKETFVQEEDGSLNVYVVDPSGVKGEDGKLPIRYSGASGNPMTILERAREMKTDKRLGIFFPSEAPAGSNSRPGASARPIPAGQKDTKSPLQKIQDGLRAQEKAGAR